MILLALEAINHCFCKQVQYWIIMILLLFFELLLLCMIYKSEFILIINTIRIQFNLIQVIQSMKNLDDTRKLEWQLRQMLDVLEYERENTHEQGRRGIQQKSDWFSLSEDIIRGLFKWRTSICHEVGKCMLKKYQKDKSKHIQNVIGESLDNIKREQLPVNTGQAIKRKQHQGKQPQKRSKNKKRQPLFCICRVTSQQKKHLPMMDCTKCQEWFHFVCIGFIGTKQQAQNLEFLCVKCLRKETGNMENLFNKYRKLFSEDSLILKAIPMTLNTKNEKGASQRRQNPKGMESLQSQNIQQKYLNCKQKYYRQLQTFYFNDDPQEYQ